MAAFFYAAILKIMFHQWRSSGRKTGKILHIIQKRINGRMPTVSAPNSPSLYNSRLLGQMGRRYSMKPAKEAEKACPPMTTFQRIMKTPSSTSSVPTTALLMVGPRQEEDDERHQVAETVLEDEDIEEVLAVDDAAQDVPRFYRGVAAEDQVEQFQGDGQDHEHDQVLDGHGHHLDLRALQLFRGWEVPGPGGVSRP